MLIYHQDIPRYLENYLPQTSIIHFHGVENGVDHLGIDKLHDRIVDLILSRLRNFTGTLSIEVFSFGDLKNSLEVLEQRWKKE
jgi:sugar phosphate isomerase/epimerase